MRIRRLTLTLSPRMRGTAGHDARMIAEALGRALAERGAASGPIILDGLGQSASVLSQRIAQAASPKGGRHGG